MAGFFGRLLGVPFKHPEHTFVSVGYPKVGNTWLRVMLGRYLQLLGNMTELPLMEPTDALILSKALGAQASGYFTHAPLEWTKQTRDDLTEESVVWPFRKLKVILLVRYPLDALVSSHKQQRYRDKSNPFEGDFASFLTHPVFGLEKLLQFYQLWFDGRNIARDLALWRYEDAKRDPAGSLRKVVTFLGLSCKDDLIIDAVEFARFDNMKAMEMAGAAPTYRSSGLGIFATGDRSNPDAFHVRKGELGEYRNELSFGQATHFDALIRANLPSFYGY